MSIEKQLHEIQHETSKLIQNINGNIGGPKKILSFNSQQKIKGVFTNKKIFYGIPFVISFLGLFFTKPDIIMKNDKNETKKIDWNRFIPLTLILTLILDIGVYFILLKMKK